MMSAALSKPRISRAASMPFSPGIMMSSRYSVKRSWRAASSSAAALRKLFTRTGVPRSSSHAPISSVRLPSSSVWSSQTAMYMTPSPFPRFLLPYCSIPFFFFPALSHISSRKSIHFKSIWVPPAEDSCYTAESKRSSFIISITGGNHEKETAQRAALSRSGAHPAADRGPRRADKAQERRPRHRPAEGGRPQRDGDRGHHQIHEERQHRPARERRRHPVHRVAGRRRGDRRRLCLPRRHDLSRQHQTGLRHHQGLLR